MSTIRKWCGCPLVALLVTASAIAGDTFELKGKVTNPFTEEQFRSVTVLVTDRLARALNCFTQVLDMNPSFNPMAYKYISSIRVKKGDTDGAARALEGYLAQFPDAPDRDRVQQILKKLGR